jgi:hypothetical protein
LPHALRRGHEPGVIEFHFPVREFGDGCHYTKYLRAF